MTAKLTGYQLFMGAASAISLTLLGVLVTQMLGQAGTLGAHGERLDQLDGSITRSQTVLSERFDEMEAILAGIQRALDISATDLKRLIADMGIVESGEVFEAAVYDGSVWIFPTTDNVASRLQEAGIEREQVNNALFGYRVINVEPTATIDEPSQPADDPVKTDE